MGNLIQFTVPGKPFGKQRPRATKRGKYLTIYTPNRTHQYEVHVQKTYKHSDAGNKYIEGAVGAKVVGYFEPPTSMSKRKKTILIEQQASYTGKPDNDNMCKSILDALNEIAYRDDSQIAVLSGEKIYGEESRVDVKLYPLNGRIITKPLIFSNHWEAPSWQLQATTTTKKN